MSVDKIIRQDILAMPTYKTARDENQQAGIMLNANENPFLKHHDCNRYPERQPKRLRTKLAALYGVNEKELLITRGSDEGIECVVRAFCQPAKDSLLICPPSFDYYEMVARVHNVQVHKIALNDEWQLNVDAIKAQINHHLKIIMLCSPNNPTGNLLSQDDIITLCEYSKDTTMIVVDEAYIEFTDRASCSDYIKKYPNLIVLRTLSKAYGLAGVRCGAVIANAKTIALVSKVLPPYPIATPIIEIVNSTIDNPDIKRQIETIKREKNKLITFLTASEQVETVWPSDANFILVKFKESAKIFDWCKQHNIILRDRSHVKRLENCLRISVGTPEENLKLCEVLANVT